MICPEYTQIRNSRQSSLLADAGMGDFEGMGSGCGGMRDADGVIGLRQTGIAAGMGEVLI